MKATVEDKCGIELAELFDGYTRATGVSVGLILDPATSFAIKPVEPSIRADFHDTVPGIRDKRLKRFASACAKELQPGETDVLTCPVGLVDAVVALPVAGAQRAWLVAGGVFYEQPDLRQSEAYAKQRGFVVEDYLAAVKAVKVISEAELSNHIDHLAKLASVMVGLDHAPNTDDPDSQISETVFHLANDALVLLDGDRIVDVNAKAVEIYGIPREQLIGSTPMDLSPEFQPSGVPTITEAVDLVKKTLAGEPQRFEWKHLRGDGTEFDADVSLTKTEISGEPRILSVVRDISEQKRIQRELEESTELYRNMFSTAVVPLFRSRISDGKITRINEVGARLIGYESPQHVLDAQVKSTDFYSEDDRAAILKAFEEKGRVDDYHVHFTLADGSIRDLAVTIKAYPEHDYLEGVVIDITERKRVEDELNTYRGQLEELVEQRTRQVDQFRRFVDNSNQGMGWIDLDGQIQYVNRRLSEMLQFSDPADLIGVSVGSMYDDETRKLLETKVLKEVLETGHRRVEIELLRRDGSRIPSDNNLYLLRDSEGNPQFIANVVTDLSERVKVEKETRELNKRLSDANENLVSINEELQATNEELGATNAELVTMQREVELLNEELEQRVEKRTTELHQSQELFKLATTAANVGLWDFNPTTAEIYQLSDQWFQMLGFPPDELLHSFETWKELMHPDDLPETSKQLQEHLEKRESEYTPVFRMKTKAGGYRWIMARGNVIEWDAKGQPIRMVGTHTDISDMKAVEYELTQTQLELKNSYLEMVQIFDTASSGMRVVDLNGIVKYANRRFADICGRSILEMTGSSYHVVPTGCIDLLSQAGNLSDLQQDSTASEIEIIRPSGEVRVCEVRSVPYLDYNGELIGILEDFQDVTDARQAEQHRREYVAKLLSANDALEHSQQKLKESQNQLIQSEKLAAIGELASGVAHELNQPLNHISITAQLLERMLKKDNLAPQQIIEELQVVRTSVSRAVEIIRNMRDFSRKDDEVKTPVDVRLAVTSALSMFGTQLRTHNIELKVVQPSEPVLVFGTENSLVQVIVNLVSNARDALDNCEDDRDKVILIEIEEKSDSIGITVQDTGAGIPEHLLGTIFNPFFTSKEPGAGTGLGLSISHRIIEDLGGTICAESSDADGTKIIVSLPKPQASELPQSAEDGSIG